MRTGSQMPRFHDTWQLTIAPAHTVASCASLRPPEKAHDLNDRLRAFLYTAGGL